MTTEGVSVSHLTWCTSSATPMDISVRLILYRSCDKYSTYLITNTAQTLWEILFKLSANTVQILQYRLENSRGQWTPPLDNYSKKYNNSTHASRNV